MDAMFSRATIDFLVENRLRNDKAWFDAHKAQYNQYVIQPLAALVTALAPALKDVDGQLACVPKVGGSISRIWRDTRFSKDKSLFRDNMWCMFVREKGAGLPEFFFVVTPNNFLYGCGYYSAGAASMESMRELILAGDNAFRAALDAYEGQDVFQLEGDMYKRSRHPSAPDNLRAWLDRKSICLIRYSDDFDTLFSGRLPELLTAGYKALAPAYRFFIKAEEGVARRPGV